MLARLHRATAGWKTHAVSAAVATAAVVAWRCHMLTGAEAFANVRDAMFASTFRSAVATTAARPCR